MKIAINQILGVSISSYRWPLQLTDYIDDMICEDLYEISKNNKVKILNRYVDRSKIDYDFTFVDNMLENQSLVLTNSLDLSCLKKYWITINGYEIRKPRFYNFEDDELLINFETSDWDWRKQYPDLIPFVQEYIDNVRQKSRDGYISFEPDKIEDVEKWDYAYIRAVLKKEDMLDNNKYWLEEWINDIVEQYYEYVDDVRYEYRWRKFKLDYDNKRLLLCKK